VDFMKNEQMSIPGLICESHAEWERQGPGIHESAIKAKSRL